MQVPRITKITLNMGVGEAVADRKVMEHAVEDMTKIAGQKPIVINARKSVAGFKVREGWPVGCKVTLRREQMYEFLDRLINIAIPRIRDFRGMNPKGFDGRGNYNMGVQRADHLSGDQLRQDRRPAWNGHYIYNNREHGRGRTRTAEGVQLPVQELRQNHGKEFHDCPRGPAYTRREEVRGKTRRAEGDHQEPRPDRMRNVTRRS